MRTLTSISICNSVPEKTALMLNFSNNSSIGVEFSVGTQLSQVVLDLAELLDLATEEYRKDLG